MTTAHDRLEPDRPRGWLLVLCLLLLVWQPLSLALIASDALDALPVVGTAGAAADCACRGGVRHRGRLFWWRSAESVWQGSRWSSRLRPTGTYRRSSRTRAPGETPLYVAASLIYSAFWLAYLARSERVKRMVQDG